MPNGGSTYNLDSETLLPEKIKKDRPHEKICFSVVTLCIFVLCVAIPITFWLYFKYDLERECDTYFDIPYVLHTSHYSLQKMQCPLSRNVQSNNGMSKDSDQTEWKTSVQDMNSIFIWECSSKQVYWSVKIGWSSLKDIKIQRSWAFMCVNAVLCQWWEIQYKCKRLPSVPC